MDKLLNPVELQCNSPINWARRNVTAVSASIVEVGPLVWTTMRMKREVARAGPVLTVGAAGGGTSLSQ